MEVIILILVILMAIYALYISKKRSREKFIENYRLPNTLREKLVKTYPHLSQQDVNHVIKGLKQYFLLCQRANKNMVAMPSQAVDVVWHEFILFTRKYDAFCQQAFGRFLHHTPAEAMSSPTSAQKGIKLAWKLACKEEGISVKSPKRLPMLFAMDSVLKIEDGFRYQLNCKKSGANTDASGGVFCASHIGCTSGCGGGFGCASGCGGDGGGGGCGGS